MEVIDLAGRRGLVVGVVIADSLAWSAARHFRSTGAELTLTYYNEMARPTVAPLAEEAQRLPCNALQEGQLELLFDALRERWAKLDFIFQSIASAREDDLQGDLTDCARAASGITCFDEVLDEVARRAP